MHVKKGDKVIIIAGKDKGKSGTIAKVILSKNRVVVEGAGKFTKHQRARSQDSKGQKVEITGSIHSSNVKKSDK